MFGCRESFSGERLALIDVLMSQRGAQRTVKLIVLRAVGLGACCCSRNSVAGSASVMCLKQYCPAAAAEPVADGIMY